jgi:hypothetical protein
MLEISYFLNFFLHYFPQEKERFTYPVLFPFLPSPLGEEEENIRTATITLLLPFFLIRVL